MGYLLVLLSAVAMSGAQLLLKEGLLQEGGGPQKPSEFASFFLRYCTNLYVLCAVILTIVTAFAWILALSKAELSQIYPFMALSYVLVALFSLLVFKEDVSLLRWVGILVICSGVLLVSRS